MKVELWHVDFVMGIMFVVGGILLEYWDGGDKWSATALWLTFLSGMLIGLGLMEMLK